MRIWKSCLILIHFWVGSKVMLLLFSLQLRHEGRENPAIYILSQRDNHLSYESPICIQFAQLQSARRGRFIASASYSWYSRAASRLLALAFHHSDEHTKVASGEERPWCSRTQTPHPIWPFSFWVNKKWWLAPEGHDDSVVAQRKVQI